MLVLVRTNGEWRWAHDTRRLLGHPAGVVVALIVTIAIVATIAVCVVAAVNAMTRRVQEQRRHETARIFKITHNVVFIPTHLKDITVSDQTVVVVGPTPVNTESKELVCVVNEGKKAV